LQLVFFVLIVQGASTLIENTAFRYRAVSERMRDTVMPYEAEPFSPFDPRGPRHKSSVLGQ
jgi:hypothetical protein